MFMMIVKTLIHYLICYKEPLVIMAELLLHCNYRFSVGEYFDNFGDQFLNGFRTKMTSGKTRRLVHLYLKEVCE